MNILLHSTSGVSVIHNISKLTDTNITRIIKNIFNKMKEDVGMSNPKKHANKV